MTDTSTGTIALNAQQIQDVFNDIVCIGFSGISGALPKGAADVLASVLSSRLGLSVEVIDENKSYPEERREIAAAKKASADNFTLNKMFNTLLRRLWAEKAAQYLADPTSKPHVIIFIRGLASDAFAYQGDVDGITGPTWEQVVAEHEPNIMDTVLVFTADEEFIAAAQGAKQGPHTGAGGPFSGTPESRALLITRFSHLLQNTNTPCPFIEIPRKEGDTDEALAEQAYAAAEGMGLLDNLSETVLNGDISSVAVHFVDKTDGGATCSKGDETITGSNGVDATDTTAPATKVDGNEVGND